MGFGPIDLLPPACAVSDNPARLLSAARDQPVVARRCIRAKQARRFHVTLDRSNCFALREDGNCDANTGDLVAATVLSID
jgi:hypothetical protein